MADKRQTERQRDHNSLLIEKFAIDETAYTAKSDSITKVRLNTLFNAF